MMMQQSNGGPGIFARMRIRGGTPAVVWCPFCDTSFQVFDAVVCPKCGAVEHVAAPEVPVRALPKKARARKKAEKKADRA